MLLAASPLLAQAPLVRARTRVSDSFGRTQNFVCAVSIERTAKAGSAAPTSLPGLKVNTGVIDGRELYETVPETEIPVLQSMLEEYTSAGTGAYALYSRPVFMTTLASFYDQPAETLNGKPRLRWDFRMPKESSRYAIAIKGQRIPAGYSGSLWVDPDSFDLARLELQADDIPPDSGIKSIVQRFDYGRARIADIDVLMPVASELIVKTGDGERKLTAQYSDCRRFESKLARKMLELTPVTAAAPGQTAAGTPPAEASIVPNGLRMETTLETVIDERTVAANDTVSFRLTRDLKAKDGAVVARKGAVLDATLIRIGQHVFRVGSYWKRYYLVGIRAAAIQDADKTIPLNANLEIMGPTASLMIFLPFSQDPGKWGPGDYTIEARDRLTFPKNTENGESIIGVWIEYLRIPKGIRCIWSTGFAAQQ